MAGSIKFFVYTTDFGDSFAIRMDESNGEAVGNSDYTPGDAAIRYMLPRNIQPRVATYRTLDGRQSRDIVVTNPAATTLSLPPSIVVADGSVAGLDMFLAQFKGEVFRPVPSDVDTGLNDGDDT